MPTQASRAERIVSTMVWLNLAASLVALSLAVFLAHAGARSGRLSIDRLVLAGMFTAWGVALGVGVWRFFRRPCRGTAREIALMTALLFGGALVGGGVRGLILGRRISMPVALVLLAAALVAIWIVYRFFLRRSADAVYPE